MEAAALAIRSFFVGLRNPFGSGATSAKLSMKSGSSGSPSPMQGRWSSEEDAPRRTAEVCAKRDGDDHPVTATVMQASELM
jgi:hypothetical protein